MKERVFVSLNPIGEVVITPAEAESAAAQDSGLVYEDLNPRALDSGGIDSAGRLRLPPEILSYLERT